MVQELSYAKLNTFTSQTLVRINPHVLFDFDLVRSRGRLRYEAKRACLPLEDANQSEFFTLFSTTTEIQPVVREQSVCSVTLGL